MILSFFARQSHTTLILLGLLPALAIVTCRPAWSSDEQRLSLAACYNAAELSHPEMALSSAEIDVARTALELEASTRSPLISLNSELGYIDGQSVGARGIVTNTTDGKDFTGEYLNGKLVAKLPIFADGAFWGQKSSRDLTARLGVEEAERNQDLARYDLLARVTDTFLQVQKYRRAVEIHTELKTAAEKLYAEAEAGYQFERISRAELLHAEYLLKRAQRDHLEMALSYDMNKQRLGMLTGLDLQELRLQELNYTPAPALSYEELAAERVHYHPRVLAQKARLSKLRQEVETTRKSSLPTLDFMASYGAGTDFDSSENDKDNILVTLNLNYDLYDSGRKTKEEVLALNRLKTEQARLSVVISQVEQDAMDAYYRLQGHRAELDLLKKQQLQLEEKTRVDRARLSFGQISPPDFEGSKSELKKNLLSQYFVLCDLIRENENLHLFRRLSTPENSPNASLPLP